MIYMPTIEPSRLLEIANIINEEIDSYSVKTLSDKPRAHLGISEIGSQCSRQLYYKFHWMKFEKYEGRMLRLFKRGHREEERFINYLEGIGCKVKRFDDSGKQFRVSGIMGHYGGSCDGVAMTPWADEPFLLEFKTHNTKSFCNYIDKGLHKSKPQHYDQMCGYGAKMNLNYAIYLPENKNDDDVKVTVLKLDHERGMQLERKAEEIITAKEPPARISNNAAFFECKWCVFVDICHHNEIPVKNCRSCRMCTPVEGSQWHCSRFNQNVPLEFIIKGCDKWVPI